MDCGHPTHLAHELAAARLRFVHSLAGYSAATYLLAIKDRHNGNIMLDRMGHLIHIDFGFVFGGAPGGACSLEAPVPFKLTREMVDVLGGPTSRLYTVTLVSLIEDALGAAFEHSDEIVGLAEMSAGRSGLRCFEGAAGAHALAALRERLNVGRPDKGRRARVEELVRRSYDSPRTKAYDAFQKWSNNINE